MGVAAAEGRRHHPHFLDIGYGPSVACTVGCTWLMCSLCMAHIWPMYDLDMAYVNPTFIQRIYCPYMAYIYIYIYIYIYCKNQRQNQTTKHTINKKQAGPGPKKISLTSSSRYRVNSTTLPCVHMTRRAGLWPSKSNKKTIKLEPAEPSDHR